MLAIYNESKHAWSVTELTKYVSKISSDRIVNKNNTSITRHTDVLVSNDLGTFNLDNYINMTECVSFYEGSNYIKFQQKDERALITTGTKYNTNVLFINILLKGSIVKDFVHSSAVHCMNNMIVGGELILVLEVKDSNKAEDLVFDIVLHNAKNKIDTTYTFTKVGNEFVVSTIEKESEEIIEKPVYKFIQYRPSRVTHLVFVEDRDVNRFNSICDKDKHDVRAFADGTNSDLATIIDSAKADKYKAVTVFLNTDKVIKQDYGTYTDIVNTVKENFRTVNILLNNGKILKR